MPPITGKNGAKTPVDSVSLSPEVHAIYTKDSIDAFGTNLHMDKYAESISVPSGLYGQDEAGTDWQNNDGNADTRLMDKTKDVTNIRMMGKDDLARYLTYGDAGLMGRNAQVGDTGLTAFDPYHLAAAAYDPAGGADFSFDGVGAAPKFERNWSAYEIPLNDDRIWQNQLAFQKNDTLPDYEISGYIKRFGDINKIDNWMKLLLPTDKNRNLFKEQGITAAIMMDQFYRQNLLNSCSDGGDIAINTVDADGWEAFQNRLDDIAENLSFFGAKPVKSMKTGTTVPSSVPLEERFIVLFHPKLERFIKKMPDFVHVNEYGYKPADPMEFGSWGLFAFVRMESIAAHVSNKISHDGDLTMADLPSDTFTTGMRFGDYNFLILSHEGYGALQMRGLKNYNIHVVDGKKAAPGNPLALASTYGWISYGGFIMKRPTHVWKIKATFTYTAT